MLSQFQTVFTQMVILFAIMAVGFCCKKLHVMDDELDRKLSTLVLSTSLPATILASVLAADELPSALAILQTMGLSCLSFAVLIACALLVTFLLRVPHGHRGVYRFMLTFANTGFLGYPVVNAIFGSEAVIYACIYNLPFNFLVFTLGVWFIASDNDYGVKVRMSPKDFLTPAVVASIVAIVCALLGVYNVPVLGDAVETLSQFTTPAALLIVGSSLANLPTRQLMGGPRLVAASVVRVAVLPVVMWAALHFFADGELLAVLVVLAGMPVATNGTILCYRYGGDAKSMAQATFLTTVLSLLSTPVLAAVLLA